MESTVCTGERGGVPAGTRLIETFGYVPGQGIARLPLHLARLEHSARVLGFSFDQPAVVARIAALGGTRTLRCRLTLGRDGDLLLETAEMPKASLTPWVFRVAPERVCTNDPFLHHKTSQRAFYDRWRTALPKGVQEWLFLNERDEVCEGTITNVVATMPDGARLTPTVASGCLPGVYRQSLLDAGLIQEAVVSVAMLRAAVSVQLINALRGEIAARDG